MAFSVLLSLFMACGILLAALGLVWPSLAARRHLRQQVLGRLAQPVPQLQGDTARPVALRRADGTWWSDLLAELSPRREAGDADDRRILLIRLGLVVATLGAGLAALVLTGSWIGLFLGIVLPFLGWLFYLRFNRARRLDQIEETVPEAMEMIVRALRIGQPVAVALQSAAKDLTGPLAEEFTSAAERISYGQGAAAALKDMAERCSNQNLRFLAAAVSIQTTAGGNLADVLERLAEVARGRLQMRRKIRAITAESKWSGRFLSAFPLLATGALLIINPGFYDGVSDKPFFRPLMAGVAGLLVMNILFMRWLLKLE